MPMNKSKLTDIYGKRIKTFGGKTKILTTKRKVQIVNKQLLDNAYTAIFNIDDIDIGPKIEELIFDEIENLALENTGQLAGCAVSYIYENVRKLAFIRGGSHQDIINWLINNRNEYISISDDNITLYGFITEKGYFVNRYVAMNIYFQQCEKVGIEKPNTKYSLYSHHVRWNLFPLKE